VGSDGLLEHGRGAGHDLAVQDEPAEGVVAAVRGAALEAVVEQRVVERGGFLQRRAVAEVQDDVLRDLVIVDRAARDMVNLLLGIEAQRRQIEVAVRGVRVGQVAQVELVAVADQCDLPAP
jgi:hypothetical protein